MKYSEMKALLFLHMIAVIIFAAGIVIETGMSGLGLVMVSVIILEILSLILMVKERKKPF